MKIDILTLFPDMFKPLQESIVGRAVKNNKLEINIINIRDFSLDKHKKCDDTPYGGGAGMLMTCEPIARAFEHLDSLHAAHHIFMSPCGKTFNQKMVSPLLEKEHLILLCGHYEGVDQRVIDLFIDEEISIGDFVLTGGELPAMCVVDSIARYIDGVISEESLTRESFSNGMLEHSQYTRPAVFRGIKVPEVLISGHHENVEKFRVNESKKITKQKRPDLIKE